LLHLPCNSHISQTITWPEDALLLHVNHIVTDLAFSTADKHSKFCEDRHPCCVCYW